MNEFARILLGCYSDSEDKILVPRSRSERQTEEEMPPSLKVTKLKIETKLSELWLVIIKPVIWFEKLRSILTMLSCLTLLYILHQHYEFALKKI